MTPDATRRSGQPVPIFDDFNRSVADLDGDTTSDGNGQWQTLRATGGVWQTNGSKAIYTGSDADHPVAVVDAGTPDVDITMNTASGYDSLVFRANDADNYWFASTYYNSSTNATGNTTKYCTGYTWNCCNSNNSNNCASTHSHGCASCSNNTSSTCCCNTGAYQHNHTCTHYHTTSCGSSNTFSYTCGTNTNFTTFRYYRLYFYKREAGVVNSAASYAATNTYVNTVRVHAQGNAINFYLNGSASAARTVDDTFNSGATKHGIGRYPVGGSAFSDAIDNFDLTPVEPT